MPQPRFMQEQNLKDMLKNYAWQQEHERICSQTTPNIDEIKKLLNKKKTTSISQRNLIPMPSN